MKPSKLYIENFMCHEKSYIDFSQFSSALIVGKVDNNELYSNGVGKTTIFKAIEYVLFNQADINLEKIIRDDTDGCKVVLDFWIGNQEYRISRKRTKKGATDVTLLQRNSSLGSEEEVYHSKDHSSLSNDKFWKDISGRRAADTEKELEKLIKINFKSFRSTVHFLQNDFSGLTTSTPEKRKVLFKDALNLIVYSKLEKISKEKANSIFKEIEKHRILIENLGDIDGDLSSFKEQFFNISNKLLVLNENLNDPKKELIITNEKLMNLSSSHKELENKYLVYLNKEKSILNDKSKIDLSLKEYQEKKSLAVKIAKDLVDEIKSLKELSEKLSENNFSEIEILSELLNDKKQTLAHFNVIVQNNISKYEKLKIPVPNENICKHCRQPMTDEHKKVCKSEIIKDMELCQKEIQSAKKEIVKLNSEISSLQQNINSLVLSKKQLEENNNKILNKNKELKDKKEWHLNYSSLISKFRLELEEKNNELIVVQEELKNSSLSEANILLVTIEEQKKLVLKINNDINSLNKEIAHLNASNAVLQHNIDQKTKDNVKKISLSNKLIELDKKYVMYPKVIQAFSSTGIPNLIIQNVLDDLQHKANELLAQLKPGLQLLFVIEKTKDDGSEADTLDIKYHVNGKERYYEQLSGAMKLAVTFSLKLGLSFLLQDMVGTDIKFLLLDEIDQSLDKASVDAFADIVKFFQKDYIILIITHNDRLKDKFSHAILVEQDMNMVSRARVVNNW